MKLKLNPLNLIILLSLLLFITAVIIKFNREDNSETITPPSMEISKTEIIVDKNKQLELLSIEQEKTIEQSNDYSDTPEVTVEKIENKLNMSLMYKTPEDIVNAIDYYQDIGNAKKANEFIEYLLTTFPDYNYE